MQTLPINSASFGSKNTYLIQAEKALTKDDKNKFMSYHYEARARAHYLKFLQKKAELDQLRGKDLKLKDWFDVIKVFSKMGHQKFVSWYDLTEAFKRYPMRFD